jgi:CBS domain-containing membrane protein
MRSAIAWLGIELNVVSAREKWISAFGGFVSMLFLLLITAQALGSSHATGLLGSMGASAVLLFAVPHGQLSQPWPVVGGHCLSALIGVACARWIHPLPVAAALSVGLSIGVMHQLKCIHPPGGATALTAVLGGPTIHALGFEFVLCPVFANCLVMLGSGVFFNSFFGWRRYPAAFNRPATATVDKSPAPSHEEVMEALRKLDSFVDISEEDLVRLVQILNGSKQPTPSGTRKKLAALAKD